MSFHFYEPSQDLIALGCRPEVVLEAKQSNRQVVQIIHDGDDIPEHCKGWVQWSVRPFVVTDRCDGTRDSNLMLVVWNFCKTLGLDLKAIQTTADPDECDLFSDDYVDYLHEHEDQTVIPEITDESLGHILASLYSMNWRSLETELRAAFESVGYSPLELDL